MKLETKIHKVTVATFFDVTATDFRFLPRTILCVITHIGFWNTKEQILLEIGQLPPI